MHLKLGYDKMITLLHRGEGSLGTQKSDYAIFSRPHKGLAGSFGALLVGWLLVVVRGLYLARHLFTLYDILYTTYIILKIINGSHSEWENSNLDHLHNADQSRHTAERIRAEVEFVYSRPRGSSINPQKILNLGFLV